MLLAHLSREEGRPVSEADATRWLEDAGFVRSSDYWIVSEADLGQLDPSEVSEVLSDDPSNG
jgi:hypothetical protein